MRFAVECWLDDNNNGKSFGRAQIKMEMKCDEMMKWAHAIAITNEHNKRKLENTAKLNREKQSGQNKLKSSSSSSRSNVDNE